MQDTIILAITAIICTSALALAGLYAYILHLNTLTSEAACTQRALIRAEQARQKQEAESSQEQGGMADLIAFATNPNNAVLIQQVIGQIRGQPPQAAQAQVKQ